MRSALALLVLGCALPEEAPPVEVVDTAMCTPLDWRDFGHGAMTTWCTPCHASAVTGSDRQGAPVGVDLDTLEGVRAWAGVIAAVATDATATMPPVGGPTPQERADLAEWLACGAPGVPLPDSDGCVGRTVEGDLVVAGSDVPLDACVITGDLRVTGNAPAEVVLASLVQVGGAVHIEDSKTRVVRLPRLQGRIERLVLHENPELVELDLGELERVDAEVLVTSNGLGGSLLAEQLVDVGGSVVVSELPRLERLVVHRLTEVGGALELRGLPAMKALDATDSLVYVGGDLTVADAGLTALEAFPHLESVGRVTLQGLSIERLDAFSWLSDADAVVLDELPALVVTRGFHRLTELSGPLSITNTPVGVLDGFRRLETVGSLTLHGTETLTLAPLSAMRTVDVDLVLEANTRLRVVTGLHGLERVGGDVVLRENPALTPDAVRALTQAIGSVGGEIVID